MARVLEHSNVTLGMEQVSRESLSLEDGHREGIQGEDSACAEQRHMAGPGVPGRC